MKKSFLLLFVLLSACGPRLVPSHEASTVSVTELSSRSGGSGTIIYSDANQSLVLTNAHVCGVVVRGGLVHNNLGRAASVVAYRVSQIHDLCLISVESNLGPAAHISLKPPARYSKSLAVGHPRLLPTISTPGQFSDNIMVQVITGERVCTDAEKTDEATGMLCTFFGGLPIIKNYEAATTSSLIQPGSSGSAIYGEDGGISAVVFAGSGDIGYGMAVPYEYVVNFIMNEAPGLKSQAPNPFVELSTPKVEKHSAFNEKLQQFCSNTTNPKTKEFCKKFQSAIKLDDLIERDSE